MSNASLSPQEIHVLMEDRAESVILLDVRSQEEYQQVHIDKSVLMPLNTLGSRLSELNKNKKIIVYCASGGRSQMACDILHKSGFDVVNMAGGISVWMAHGLPVRS